MVIELSRTWCVGHGHLHATFVADFGRVGRRVVLPSWGTTSPRNFRLDQSS